MIHCCPSEDSHVMLLAVNDYQPFCLLRVAKFQHCGKSALNIQLSKHCKIYVEVLLCKCKPVIFLQDDYMEISNMGPLYFPLWH